jgi:hypothetical protein
LNTTDLVTYLASALLVSVFIIIRYRPRAEQKEQAHPTRGVVAGAEDAHGRVVGTEGERTGRGGGGGDHVSKLMQVVITVSLLAASLWIILTGDEMNKDFAYGMLGTLVGYWMPGPR